MELGFTNTRHPAPTEDEPGGGGMPSESGHGGASAHRPAKGEIMAGITILSRARRQVLAVVLGVAASAIVVPISRAQISPQAYSVVASQMMPGLGPTGLITLPGQNGAQRAMSGSINNCLLYTSDAADE